MTVRNDYLRSDDYYSGEFGNIEHADAVADRRRDEVWYCHRCIHCGQVGRSPDT